MEGIVVCKGGGTEMATVTTVMATVTTVTTMMATMTTVTAVTATVTTVLAVATVMKVSNVQRVRMEGGAAFTGEETTVVVTTAATVTIVTTVTTVTKVSNVQRVRLECSAAFKGGETAVVVTTAATMTTDVPEVDAGMNVAVRNARKAREDESADYSIRVLTARPATNAVALARTSTATHPTTASS